MCWLVFVVCTLLANQVSTLKANVLGSIPLHKARINDLVTLPCQFHCTGRVEWKKWLNGDFKSFLVCDENKCTVLDGFKNRTKPHVQGLAYGDLSLTIPSLKPEDVAMYACYCGEEIVCDMIIQVTAHWHDIEVKAEECLAVDLLGLDSVRVSLNRSASITREELICLVEDSVPYGKPSYSGRVAVKNSSLEICGLTSSDSGLVTVREGKNTPLLSTVNVTVSSRGAVQLKRSRVHLCWPLLFLLFVILIVVLIIRLKTCIQYRSNNQADSSFQESENTSGGVKNVKTPDNCIYVVV